MRQNLAGVRHEQSQQRIFNRRELDFLAAFADDARGQIHLQFAAAENRVRSLRLGVPQHGTETREQFGAVERLRHVIVRARVKRGHLVVLAVAHAQDDDRHTAPFAQALQHFHAFEIGQAEVEQNRVGPALGGLGDAVRSGRGVEDTIAVRLQRDAQETLDLRLVVNDEGNGQSR